MRLSSFHIDGFGALSDVGLEEVAPNLVVILGPNEAGKSTLFDFLAGVLFGFPARKDNPRYHAPARGGRHGGRVGFVDEAGGTWIVSRHAGAHRGLEVRLPDGSDGDEATLSRALAGASLSLFLAVFAVGLDDLGQMGNLESDEVRELLFAASIFGQRRSATKAMKHLAEARDELARPRRDDATANRLARQLEVVRSDLAEARQESASYESLRLQAAQVEAQVDVPRSQLKALRNRERELQVLETCWKHRCDAGQAREALSDAPALAEAAALLERGGELRLLAAELSGHLERAAKLDELRRNRASQDTSIERRLLGLGVTWTRQRAQDAPDPGLLADSVRAARERRAALQTDVASSSAVLSQAEAWLAGCGPDDSTEPFRHATTADEPIPARADLELRTEALTELRERTGEAERLELEIVSEERSEPPAPSGPPPWPRSTRPVLFVPWMLAIGFSALGATLLSRRQIVLGAVALALGVALVLAAGLNSRAHQGSGTMVLSPTRAPGASGAGGSTSGERADLLARTRIRIGDLAGSLGLEVPPLRVDIDRCAAVVQRQYETRRRLDDLAAARGEAEVRVARAAAADRRARTALQLELQGHEAWCERHGFAPGNPEETLESVAALSDIRELLSGNARVGKAVNELAPSIASFTHRFRTIVTAVDPDIRWAARDRPRATPSEATRARVVAGRTAETGDDDGGIAAVNASGEAAELAASLSGLVRRLDDAAALDARRSALSAALADAEAALEHSLGEGEGAERMRVELARGDVLTWATERAELEPSIEGLRRDEEHAVRRHQSLAEAMERVATSHRIADLERRQSALEVELDDVLRQYLVLGTARALLQRTLARHERERQPAVIASAAAHFERVTRGRYTGLLADAGADGKQTVRVLSNTGEAIDAADLSRGTIEQLYLCLRLGLADSFAQRSVSLPIVLDDVLVNFDPDRARAVANELVATAQSHQMVFLTCHPHLADMMLRAASDGATASQMIELGRVEPDNQQALPLLTALPPLSA